MNTMQNTLYMPMPKNMIRHCPVSFAENDLFHNQVPFSMYADVKRGLITRANPFFINPPIDIKTKYMAEILSRPKGINGYSTANAETDALLYLHGNRDLFPQEIKKYLTECETLMLKSHMPKTLYLKLQKSSAWYELPEIDSNGILFSTIIRNDMKFIMNTTNVFVKDNFYVIKPKIQKYLLFALLNNLYSYYQLEKTGTPYGSGLLRIHPSDLEQLVLPDISEIEPSDIQKLIELSEDMIDHHHNHVQSITQIFSSYAIIPYNHVFQTCELSPT